MSSKVCKNEVTLVGKVTSDVVMDHSYWNVNFYKFYISVERRSGAIDELPVIVSESLIDDMASKLKVGVFVGIDGEYRSYSDVKTGKLHLYVFAKGIIRYDEEYECYTNSVNLSGYVCKKNKVRVTPFGRRVMDLILAVNRYKKTAYIPCIIWNLTDEEAEKINIGDKVDLIGRVQSRKYLKHLGDTVEERVAYEVSVSHYRIENE